MPIKISCEICGEPTTMSSTKRCDRCWELETRVQNNPELVLKLLGLGEPKRILQEACDRDWENETLLQTAIIASNAIYWRDREIRILKAQVEMLKKRVK